MFGLACKGLHCAGCGKGIPLGVVLLIVGLAVGTNDIFAQALANAIMWAALIIGGCVVATGAIIATIQRADFQMSYSNWKGQTMVQAKEEESWTQRAYLGESPFLAKDKISGE